MIKNTRSAIGNRTTWQIWTDENNNLLKAIRLLSCIPEEKVDIVQYQNILETDKEEVFKKMDAIANAVSDSCEPTIIPDITLQTVDGKTVIVAEISEGRQRPYYIKALGREGGVYVRVVGTTRLADEYMIKELMFEGSNRYFDQALCTGLTIADKDIDALCKAMKDRQ